MTYDEIKTKLGKTKYHIVMEKEITNGIQIKLKNGAIINCFSNGNHL